MLPVGLNWETKTVQQNFWVLPDLENEDIKAPDIQKIQSSIHFHRVSQQQNWDTEREKERERIEWMVEKK